MKSQRFAGASALALILAGAALAGCGTNSARAQYGQQALSRAKDLRADIDANRALVTPLEYRDALAQQADLDAVIYDVYGIPPK